MDPDTYLLMILQREAVDTGMYSPIRNVISTIDPVIRAWAGNALVSIMPSGSFAKGTANHSGTDVDLFISLSDQTPGMLKELYDSLSNWMSSKGYPTRRQNVSINVKVSGYSVDLVPARRQSAYGEDHSLYRRKADTWTKTNVTTHISQVRNSGRTNEIRIIKLWRDQKGLDFPSFYLELAVIEALRTTYFGTLAGNVMKVFEYLSTSFQNDRYIDPSNTNNVISDDLTDAEKDRIKNAAFSARNARYWSDIVN